MSDQHPDNSAGGPEWDEHYDNRLRSETRWLNTQHWHLQIFTGNNTEPSTDVVVNRWPTISGYIGDYLYSVTPINKINIRPVPREFRV